MTAALAVLVLLPAVGGAVLLLTGRRADRVAGPVAVGVTGLAVVLAAVVAAGRPSVSIGFEEGILIERTIAAMARSFQQGQWVEVA